MQVLVHQNLQFNNLTLPERTEQVRIATLEFFRKKSIERFSFSGNSAIIIFACELNYIFLSTEHAAVSIVGISLRQKAISRRYEINIISISQFPVITIPYARNCRLNMTAAF